MGADDCRRVPRLEWLQRGGQQRFYSQSIAAAESHSWCSMALREFLGTGMKHLQFIGACSPLCYGILSSLTLSSLLKAWKVMHRWCCARRLCSITMPRPKLASGLHAAAAARPVLEAGAWRGRHADVAGLRPYSPHGGMRLGNPSTAERLKKRELCCHPACVAQRAQRSVLSAPAPGSGQQCWQR